jgi:hypothetical protein
MQKYFELPEASKEMHRLANVDFLCQALKNMGKWFKGYMATARQLEDNLILNDIMALELAAAVRSKVDLLKSSVHKRLNSLTSAAAAVVPSLLALEEAVAPVLVSWQQEPLMVAPLAMAPPMVVNTPLFVQQPPPLEPVLLLVPS